MLTREQIYQIIEELKKDERVQGILLTGSYVYGTPHEKSDLDVRVVTKGSANWVETESIKFGTKLEAYFNPPEVIRNYFEIKRNTGDPCTIHGWSNGEIVYDPSGIVAELQQEARLLWKAGPVNGTWIPREKYRNKEVITRKKRSSLGH